MVRPSLDPSPYTNTWTIQGYIRASEAGAILWNPKRSPTSIWAYTLWDMTMNNSFQFDAMRDALRSGGSGNQCELMWFQQNPPFSGDNLIANIYCPIIESQEVDADDRWSLWRSETNQFNLCRTFSGVLKVQAGSSELGNQRLSSGRVMNFTFPECSTVINSDWISSKCGPNGDCLVNVAPQTGIVNVVGPDWGDKYVGMLEGNSLSCGEMIETYPVYETTWATTISLSPNDIVTADWLKAPTCVFVTPYTLTSQCEGGQNPTNGTGASVASWKVNPVSPFRQLKKIRIFYRMDVQLDAGSGVDVNSNSFNIRVCGTHIWQGGMKLQLPYFHGSNFQFTSYGNIMGVNADFWPNNLHSRAIYSIDIDVPNIPIPGLLWYGSTICLEIGVFDEPVVNASTANVIKFDMIYEDDGTCETTHVMSWTAGTTSESISTFLVNGSVNYEVSPTPDARDGRYISNVSRSVDMNEAVALATKYQTGKIKTSFPKNLYDGWMATFYNSLQ